MDIIYFRLFLYYKHFRRVAWGAVLCILVSGIITPSVIQAKSFDVHTYIAKLAPGGFDLLFSVGKNIERVFPGATEESLSGIFRFNSTYSQGLLAEKLGTTAEYVYADGQVVASAVSLSDPWFTENSADINKQWYLSKVGFLNAWAISKGNPSVVVAVLDTGVDSSHEDLKNATYSSGFDFLEKKGIAPGASTDNNGHGTLITGVLVATPNNGLGVTGAVPAISIMPLIALNQSGIGQSSIISEAIVWAADHGANIINLSLSDTDSEHDVVLANAISYAFNKGVLLVAAAGNDSVATGLNLDQHPLFPVCDDNGENMVLGVSATDYRDLRPGFSNYGKSCIDVAAPGKRIISTVNIDPYSKQAAPNSYAYASGTSLAVPFVVAEAALLKAVHPYASNKQIRDAIIASSDPIDDINIGNCNGSCAGLLGAGRINAAKALEKELINERVQDGSLVQTPNGALYFIHGGKRQPVSLFIRSQRFGSLTVHLVEENELTSFPVGSYAEPLEGTLIKSNSSPTVYYMSRGIKLPITGQVFGLRAFSFANVHSLPSEEINSWVTGPFLSPTEGTLLKTSRSHTVYWVVDGALHPINYEFYTRRGLSVFPLIIISEQDLQSFSLGDAYVL